MSAGQDTEAAAGLQQYQILQNGMDIQQNRHDTDNNEDLPNQDCGTQEEIPQDVSGDKIDTQEPPSENIQKYEELLALHGAEQHAADQSCHPSSANISIKPSCSAQSVDCADVAKVEEPQAERLTGEVSVEEHSPSQGIATENDYAQIADAFNKNNDITVEPDAQSEQAAPVSGTKDTNTVEDAHSHVSQGNIGIDATYSDAVEKDSYEAPVNPAKEDHERPIEDLQVNHLMTNVAPTASNKQSVQPPHVRDARNYNNQQTLRQFDFDQQNPQNVPRDLYFSTAVRQLCVNAPARDLLSNEVPGVDGDQVRKIEMQYIQALRDELIHDRAVQQRITLDNEIYRKMLNKQALIDQSSAAATGRLNRIEINKTRAQQHYDAYQKRVQNKIIAQDERSEYMRQMRAENERVSQQLRFKDEENRAKQLENFYGALRSIQQLKTDRLANKYLREADNLNNQLVEKQVKANEMMNTVYQKQQRATKQQQDIIATERAALEDIQARYRSKSERQTLNRSQKLASTQRFMQSKILHLENVRQHSDRLKQDRLIQKQNNLCSKEARHLQNIKTLQENRNRNVQMLNKLHQQQLERSAYVKEQEAKWREQKEHARIKREEQMNAEKQRRIQQQEQEEYQNHIKRMMAGHFQYLNYNNKFEIDEQLKQMIPANSILRLSREEAKRRIIQYEEERAQAVSGMKYSTGQAENSIMKRSQKMEMTKDSQAPAHAEPQTEKQSKRASYSATRQMQTRSQGGPRQKDDVRTKILQLMQFNRNREIERQTLLQKVSSTEAAEKLSKMFDDERKIFQERLAILQQQYREIQE